MTLVVRARQCKQNVNETCVVLANDQTKQVITIDGLNYEAITWKW